MKLLLAFVGFVVLASQGTVYAKATLEELKAFEKFSPYPWTQWLKFHPGSVAAVAIAPGAYTGPVPEETEEDDTEDDSNESEDDLQSWFKRATLPEVADVKAAKAAAKAEKEKAKLAKKAEKLTATKMPSIVDVEPDFWGPPPSIAPNVTIPPPPGYWASKKAMFISKLFAALADAVVNSTGPPELYEATTTTPSPRQALLNEINNVLLSDVVRSAVPVDDSSEESDEDYEDDSDEVPAVHAVTPASEPTKLDFLGKLSSAIAAKPPKPTKAPSPWAWGKPTKPTKAPKKSKAKASKKLKGKKDPPASAPAAPAAGLDYNKLAQALLANGASPGASVGKSKKA
jgi:hypothetical protein